MWNCMVENPNKESNHENLFHEYAIQNVFELEICEKIIYSEEAKFTTWIRESLN